MKKIFTGILCLASVFALAACGSKNSTTAKKTTKNNNNNNVTTKAPAGSTTTSKNETLNDKFKFQTDSEFVSFHVSTTYQLEESAWLGIIPTGTIYEKEVDADDVDILYAYCENYTDENKTVYIFLFEKQQIIDIEDGTYDMVLCSTDDGAADGSVLVQFGIILNGDKITLDFENKN